jgi:hypothetical protein
LLASNNPDVDNSSVQEVLKTYVYVLSKDGSPLMPCTQAKARRLLNSQRATIIRHRPFTIQLAFECENKTQEVILGIDPGYENIGLSARTEIKELFAANVKLRNNVSRLLTKRAMCRRNRRYKLWYRKPRFLNRKIEKGWLSPSVQHRLDSHMRIVTLIVKILPISKVIIEVASFDIQKINNPDIKGIEYQQGNLYNYKNTKAYLVAREGGKCQLCREKAIKGNPFRIHHVIQESQGGTSKSDNLALLHLSCHEKLHKEELNNILKKNKQYKAETFMSTIKWKIVEQLKNICDTSITFGFITKLNLQRHGLIKEHNNDAFVISGGSNQGRLLPYTVIQKRGNNRCLQINRKGYKPSIRRQRYLYQPKDEVKISGNWYEVIGTHNYGKKIVIKDKAGNIIDVSTKKIEDYHYNNGWQISLLV